MRLTAELRQLRQTRTESPIDTSIADVTASLAELLSLWPVDLHVQTESISLTPNAITIRAGLSTSEDVQKLTDALAPLPGWGIDHPQMVRNRDLFNAVLRLEPTDAEKEPAT